MARLELCRFVPGEPTTDAFVNHAIERAPSAAVEDALLAPFDTVIATASVARAELTKRISEDEVLTLPKGRQFDSPKWPLLALCAGLRELALRFWVV